ncbi:MAG: hypothetical protein WAV56_01565, partial [Microgenomates group bacterium]
MVSTPSAIAFIVIAALCCLCSLYSGVAAIVVAQEIWPKEKSPIRHNILWISAYGAWMSGFMLLA